MDLEVFFRSFERTFGQLNPEGQGALFHHVQELLVQRRSITYH